MKMIMALVISISIGFAANAQKINSSDVPSKVKDSFNKLFSGTKAKWEKENGNYEANFQQQGKRLSSTFKPDGTYLETETAINTSALPGEVLKYVAVHYKGDKIKESAKITKADGTINYEAEIKGKDVIFDASGNFLQEEKD